MAALATVSAACGDAPTTSRDLPPSIASFESFVTDLSNAVCGWQTRCCSAPERDAVGMSGYLTEVECRSWMGSSLRERLSEVRFALGDRRASFDPRAAAACVAEFARTSCVTAPVERFDVGSVIFQRIDACIAPVVGAVVEGAPCFSPSECQPGTSCRIGKDVLAGEPATAGGIRPHVTIGNGFAGSRGHCDRDKQERERCSATSQCAPGLYCRRTDFVCARPGGEGDACIVLRDEVGEVTATLVACRETPDHLLCAAGKCRRPPLEGEPCLPEAPARFSCSPDAALDLVCTGVDFNGTGICSKSGKAGATCSEGGGLPACAASLACKTPDSVSDIGVCDQPPAAGQRCSLEGRCAPPAVCYGPFMTCVLPSTGRAGAPCSSDLECASLRCVVVSGSVGDGSMGICVSLAEPVACSGPGHFIAVGSMIRDPLVDGGVPPFPLSDGGAPTIRVDGGAAFDAAELLKGTSTDEVR